MLTVETLNKIANLKNKRESHREIFTALELIRSTYSEKEKLQQLMLHDIIDNNTLGHFCLQGNEFHQIAYEYNLLKLDSKNILSILFVTNNNLVSILDLYLNSSLDFFKLAYKLTSKDLCILLSKNNLFTKIIFEKSHSDNNFIERYWGLLKIKFAHFEGQELLSKLLNLAPVEIKPAKITGGQLLTYVMAKQANPDLLFDYIDFLSKLSKAKAQSYLQINQDDKKTFICLIIQRIKSAIFNNQIHDEIKIIVKLLDKFDFNKNIIQTLVHIPDLKAHVRNYLMNLDASRDNLQLLQNAIKTHNSLGKFCGQWLSLIGKYIKNEPTTITIIRARINAMQIELCNKGLNACSSSLYRENSHRNAFFVPKKTASLITPQPKWSERSAEKDVSRYSI